MPRLLFALAATTVVALAAVAQTPPPNPAKVIRGEGAVPDNMSRLSDTINGTYFVSTPLMWKYDALLVKLEGLKRDIDADRVTGPEAVKSLAELRAGLKELREQLDKSKVLITAVQAHTRTETVSFDIGPDRTVVVNAERVRLIGTDGDKIVCTLEKVYLGNDAKEADAQLALVKVAHQRKLNHYTPGKTQAEDDAEAAAFRKTPAGQKATPEELAKWARQGAQSRVSWDRYRGFWGKATDVISIEGLYSQIDSTVEIRADSKGGGGITRRARRRHATLTVAVPKCQRVSVENASASLEVVGLNGSLLFSGSSGNGNCYREADAQFTIKGVRGDIDAVGYPFTAIEGVTGNVNLLCAEDTSGTVSVPRPYEEGLQVLSRGRPMVCAIKDVGGDLKGRFARVDVHVEGVRGAVAVANGAGDTKLVVNTPLAATATHRLTSVGGSIDVKFASGALGELPLIAVTAYGNSRVKSTAVRASGLGMSGAFEFEDNFDGFSLNLPKLPIDAPVMLGGAYDRLQPGDKSPGLVIRTLTGHIVVTVADK